MGALAIERLLEESGARLTRASELPSLADARNPVATKVSALDRLLSGGLPRGALTEISGRRSCGRFSIGIASLAAVTSAGESAALVDLGGHLDPQSAEDAGVELERLLWVRPSKLKEAVASAEMLLAAGFPLVVVDLGLAPVRGRFVPDAAWVRLTRAARDRRAALLLLAPYRVSGVAAEAVVSAQTARRDLARRGKVAAASRGHRRAADAREGRAGAERRWRRNVVVGHRGCPFHRALSLHRGERGFFGSTVVARREPATVPPHDGRQHRLQAGGTASG